MNQLGSILLVEDNPGDVELTLAALGDHRLANQVVAAQDRVAALDYLNRRGRFDGQRGATWLLDLRMLRLGGTDVSCGMARRDWVGCPSSC